jgi:predicted GH43/DUF377 family glycosyl hydrolase
MIRKRQSERSGRRFEIVMRGCLLAIALGLLLPVAALRAQTTTTVADTIHGPDGSLPSGKIVITSKSTFTASDGSVVFSGAVATATVTNGTFSVSLIPNAGSTPSGTSYSAIYKLAGVPYREETWVVPLSASPVNLAAVRSAALSGPSLVVANSQLPSTISASQFLQTPSGNEGTASGFPNLGTLYIRDVPVMDDMASGGWHYNYTGDPWVFEDGGKYYMYFSGDSSAGAFKAGYATSDNLIDWTEYGSNPVIQGTGSGWDSAYAIKPSIIKIGSTYYAYVEAQNGSSVRGIGYFTAPSAEGPWTSGAQIVAAGSEPGGHTTASLEAPAVYKNGSTYYLYYSGQLAAPDYRWFVFYATSSDGVNWTRQGVAIAAGSAGTWDVGGVAPGRIIRVGNYYVMGANGYNTTAGATNSEGDSGGIGLFYSTDLVNWTEYSRDPLIPSDGPTASGNFGGNWKPYRCQLIDAHGVIWMFFNMNGTYWSGNRPGVAQERIYVARFGAPFPSGNMTVDQDLNFVGTNIGIGQPFSGEERVGTAITNQLAVTNGPGQSNVGQGIQIYGDHTSNRNYSMADITTGALWEFSMRTDDTMQVYFNSNGTGGGWHEYFLFDKNGNFMPIPVDFASLPACTSATEGATRPITNSTVNTWGSTITGGGTYHVQGYCDGTNWTVAAK